MGKQRLLQVCKTFQHNRDWQQNLSARRVVIKYHESRGVLELWKEETTISNQLELTNQNHLVVCVVLWLATAVKTARYLETTAKANIFITSYFPHQSSFSKI